MAASVWLSIAGGKINQFLSPPHYPLLLRIFCVFDATLCFHVCHLSVVSKFVTLAISLKLMVYWFLCAYSGS